MKSERPTFDEVLVSSFPGIRWSRYPTEALAELQAAEEEMGGFEEMFAARPAPLRSARGFGVLGLGEEALVLVDAGPKGTTRQVIEYESIRGISATHSVVPGVVFESPVAVVLVTDEGQTLTFAAQPEYGSSAEMMIDAIRDYAPGIGHRIRPHTDNWWEDPTITWPPPLKVKYLGGDPRSPAPVEVAGLWITRKGIEARGLRMRLRYSWEEVLDVSVEGPDQVQRRTTVTRMLAIGIFGLGWQKRLRTSFVVIETDEGEAIFESSKHTSMELRSVLAPVVAALDEESDDPVREEAVSPLDQIRQLGALLEKGLITQGEFDSKKVELLDRL